MRVEIPVFDGVDELDVFGPFEPLCSAGLDVRLVGVENAGRVTSQRGVTLVVDEVLDRPDVVMVPGGGWLNRAPEGSFAQVQRGVLPRRLHDVAEHAQVMTSVCTGAFLLQSAGLLDGRFATTNRNARDELAQTGVAVVDERVVDDGNVITAAGLSAGIDLGVWIVERLLGTGTADRVCASLEYTRQGRVWHAQTRDAHNGEGSAGRRR